MGKEISASDVLDELFKDVKFDKKLYNKILLNNVDFITKNEEHKHLFGGRLIGCYFTKYTMYDKNIFYENVFGMSYDSVSKAIEDITAINKSFKIARDDVNLVCFYVAHRFLSNSELKKDEAFEYAKEILNYFNYRTLVLISSAYFIYPISEEKALSLIERLSHKYLIKKLKNWKEYCNYRSEEYLNSKFKDLLVKFNKDDELPNAIADLYNRTKETLKSIYREFIAMNEEGDSITSKKNVINDVEGKEVIVDKLDSADKYLIKVESLLVDRTLFIKKEYINVCIDITKVVSYKKFEEFLQMLVEYNFKSRENNTRVKEVLNDIIVNAIEYLTKNEMNINSKNVLEIINALVGNVLYARGTNLSIAKVKENIDKLIKDIYKDNKQFINDRNVNNVRNTFYIYIVLLMLI